MYTMLCPGCGHRTAMTLLDELIAKKGLKEKTVLALDVACCSLLIDEVEYDSVMCAHGRVLDVAKGYQSVRKDRCVISYMGDGAAYSIGIEELIHSARRGDHAFVVVINNGLYSMTGGQVAPTYVGDAAPDDARAGFRVEDLLSSFPVRYLARAALTDAEQIALARQYLETAMDGYLAGSGFHLVELLSPCPTNYKLSPKDMADLINRQMAVHYPLGELVDHTGNGNGGSHGVC